MPKQETEEQTKKRLKGLPSKGEGGSWLYGIILMATGAFIIALGVLDLLNIDAISDLLISLGLTDWTAMLPTLGITNFVIGAFAFIAGYGLIEDQEWAWGISMFILVYIAAQSIVYIVTSTTVGVLAVSIVATAVAAVGLVYLGLTKYKYA
ncbi:MAG: hypothetical protein HWN65_12245 [Candidatus Helarchaeota archaeon]|nr:hypothetical protein [Candidatus Helarchaeota archaeon]